MRARRTALVGLVVLGLVTVLLAGWALLRSRVIPATPASPAPSASTPAPDVTPSATPRAAPSATLTAAPSTTPTPSAGTLVVLGDGYSKDADWVDQLGQELGLTVVNLSEAGMGYRMTPSTCATQPCAPFSGLVTQVRQAKPKVVVVAGGDADGDYALSPFVQATFAGLKQAVPDAEIVALSPLSSRSPRPHWLTLHGRSIETEATAARVTWVDVSAVAGKASAYEGDHLTAEASAKVAGAVAAGLQ